MTPKQFYDIVQWQRETFPESSAISKCFHLCDEVKELGLDIISDNKKGAALELADCLILLAGIAAKLNMTFDDITIVIEEKMKINKSRTWGKPDASGVVKHVEDVCKYCNGDGGHYEDVVGDGGSRMFIACEECEAGN